METGSMVKVTTVGDTKVVTDERSKQWRSQRHTSRCKRSSDGDDS